MVTTIQKWGNSQGLRIAREILEDAHLSVGDEVAVTVENGIITILPTKRIRGRHNLQEILAKIPAAHMTEEVDWGRADGKETR